MEHHAWRIHLRDGRTMQGVDDYPPLSVYPHVEQIDLNIRGVPNTFTLDHIPEGCVPYLKRRNHIDMVDDKEVGRSHFYILGDGRGNEVFVHPTGEVETRGMFAPPRGDT